MQLNGVECLRSCNFGGILSKISGKAEETGVKFEPIPAD